MEKICIITEKFGDIKRQIWQNLIYTSVSLTGKQRRFAQNFWYFPEVGCGFSGMKMLWLRVLMTALRETCQLLIMKILRFFGNQITKLNLQTDFIARMLWGFKVLDPCSLAGSKYFVSWCKKFLIESWNKFLLFHPGIQSFGRETATKSSQFTHNVAEFDNLLCGLFAQSKAELC